MYILVLFASLAVFLTKKKKNLMSVYARHPVKDKKKGHTKCFFNVFFLLLSNPNKTLDMKKGFFQFVEEGKNQGHLLRSTPGNGITLMKNYCQILSPRDQ